MQVVSKTELLLGWIQYKFKVLVLEGAKGQVSVKTVMNLQVI
jgi:hypothetical protein